MWQEGLVLWSLNEDFGLRHCLFPLSSSEPSYQAPGVHSLAAQVSASSLPGQLPNHSTGTEPGTRGPESLAKIQPGAVPGPLISIDHYWGCTGLDPPCCTAQGQAAASPRGAEGVTQTHWESHKQRVVLSADLASELNKPQSPQLEATQDDAHFLALDPAKLCSHLGSALSGHVARRRSCLSL